MSIVRKRANIAEVHSLLAKVSEKDAHPRNSSGIHQALVLRSLDSPDKAPASVVNGVGTVANWLRAKALDIGALVISLVALGLSAYSFHLTTETPEVRMQIPEKVRVMQATQDDEAELYLQPHFINTGKNARGDVIDSIDLSVTYLPNGESVERKDIWFQPESYGKWDVSKEEYDLEYFFQDSYSIGSDPYPLVLGPATSEAPVVSFEAEEGFSFEPGTYQITIRASRVSKKSEPLKKTINIELTQAYIGLLNAKGDRGVIGQVVRSWRG